MTDSNVDRELENSERNFAISDSQRSYRSIVAEQPATRRGRLTKEQAAQRRQEPVDAGTLEVAATETQPEPVQHDPEAALRHARIGVVAVAVLILMLVWIMQRKRGA